MKIPPVLVATEHAETDILLKLIYEANCFPVDDIATTHHQDLGSRAMERYVERVQKAIYEAEALDSESPFVVSLVLK